jgi:hypothetical protein
MNSSIHIRGSKRRCLCTSERIRRKLQQFVARGGRARGYYCEQHVTVSENGSGHPLKRMFILHLMASGEVALLCALGR